MATNTIKYAIRKFDGKELRPLVIKKIKDSVGNGPKYENLISWMEA
jgi:hypothetical protein